MRRRRGATPTLFITALVHGGLERLLLLTLLRTFFPRKGTRAKRQRTWGRAQFTSHSDRAVRTLLALIGARRTPLATIADAGAVRPLDLGAAAVLAEVIAGACLGCDRGLERRAELDLLAPAALPLLVRLLAPRFCHCGGSHATRVRWAAQRRNDGLQVAHMGRWKAWRARRG